MAIDEELKKRIEERRAAAERARIAQAEADAKAAALKEAESRAKQEPISKTAMTTGATSKSMTEKKVTQSLAGYTQPENGSGDNNMARVVANYKKETPNVSNMTYDDAMGFATRIVYDDERDAFLKKWQKAAGNKRNKAYMEAVPTMDEMRAYLNSQKPGGVYQAAGEAYSKQVKQKFEDEYKSMQTLHVFDGFTDMAGNAINMNTADLDDILRNIRATASPKKREAYVDALETLTKTPGNRFYGVSFDKSAAGKFLDSSALSKTDYDDEVDYFRGKFDPVSGAGEENTGVYAELREEIEQMEDGYVKRQYLDALDDAYTEIVDDKLPDLTGYTKKEEPKAEETAKDAKKEAKDSGWLDGAMSAIGEVIDALKNPKGGAVWNTQGEAYAIENGEKVRPDDVKVGEEQGPKQKKVPTLAQALSDEEAVKAFVEKKRAEAEAAGEDVGQWQGPQFKSLFERSIEDGEFQAFYEAIQEDKNKSKEVQGPAKKTPPTMRDAVEEGWETPEKQGPMYQAQAGKTHTLADAVADAEFAAEYARQQEESSKAAEEEIPNGSIDEKNNPVRAWMYARNGEGNLLTKETIDMVNELVASSPAAKAISGLDATGSMELYAQAEAGDPFALAKANKASKDYLTGGYVSVLGSTLSHYLDMAHSDTWPDELRDDMEGVVLQVGLAAEEAYRNGEFTYDPDKETLYDAYLKVKPEAANPLENAEKAVNAMREAQKEKDRLAAEEALKNEQELLRQHREQVKSGLFTQEAYDHVLMEAPDVTTLNAQNDATYRDMLSEIRTDRTLADGMEDSWQNRMAERYLRENGLPDDLNGVAAMRYKDMLSAFEEDILLEDMRIAKALGYDGLSEMYAKWGGMDVDKLHGRAEGAMHQMANSVTAEDIAEIEKSASAYMGMEDASGYYVSAVAKGLEHGAYATTADMLEAVWAFSTISLEGRADAVAHNRHKFVEKYDYALAPYMYTQAMYMYAENAPDKAHGEAIKAYLDSGSDPFLLGIDPTADDLIMDAANAIDARAQAVADWAHKTLNTKQGKWFEVASGTGSTLTMQLAATTASIVTGNPFVGNYIGYGLPSAAEEMRVQLGNGAARKEAMAMGFMHGTTDTLANMASSEKFFEKVRGFVGYSPLVSLGAKNAGNVGTARVMLGTTKAMAKGAIGQLADEVVDTFKEEAFWQFGGAAMQSHLDGASILQSVVRGYANVDVVESAETMVKQAPETIIQTLPLAFLGGLGEGFKASRAMATKLAATGNADAAVEFYNALNIDLEKPENRDALNKALHDAAVGVEAAAILVTDESVAPIVDAGAKAQEQKTAHAIAQRNSEQAAQTGFNATISAQERMNAGEVNPELVTQVANGVQAYAKNTQSAGEHKREKEQKQKEADNAFAQGVQAAVTKAEARVSAREKEAEEIANDLSVIGADFSLHQNMKETGFANKREDFELALESWDGKEGGLEFVVGEVGAPLKSLGVQDSEIVLLSDKLAKIKKDHPAMTDEVIRQLPEVVENPVVVMRSRRLQNRLTMFANVKDADGNPVLAVVTIDPKKNLISDANFIRVNSAYGKSQNPQGFIDRSEILYVDKNRAADWAVSTGLQLPVDRAPKSNSSTGMVAQESASVKRENIQAAIVPDGNIEQAQYVSMDAGRIDPTPTAGRARRNVVRTYKRLARSIGVGQVFGTRKMNDLPDQVAGYYETRANYVASRTNYGSNIEVDAHELGHAIAHRLGITGTDDMVRNLTTRFTANYPPQQLPGEAFAEFFWRYMINDDEARRFAGDAFIADFERRLRRDGTLRDVKRAQRDTRRFMLAEANDRIGLMIRDKSDKRKDNTIGESLAEFERSFISQMVDSTRPAEDVNVAVREASGGTIQERMNLRNAALMQSTAPRRAWHILMENLTDVNGTIVGKGLRQRLEEAGIRGDQFETLIEYMLAKHSLDRDVQSKPVFDRAAISTQDTRDFIERIERDNPEIVAAERAFQDFRHDFMLEYMVNTGFMTAEDLEFFETIYPHYVPTYRVKDRGRRGVGGQTYEIRRASGSTEEIINPMDSFVDMVNTIVAMNLRNETAKTWDRVYMNYEGMGIFGRRVTEDQETRIMDMRSVQENVRQLLEDSEADSDVIQNVLNAIGEEQIRRSGTDDVNLPNILTVQLPDGSKHFYEIFDNELFDMFTGTQDSGKSALSILGTLTRSMSMLTTGSNPLFFMRNAMRDFQNSVNYGSWASNYLSGGAKWLRAAWDVWRESGEYDQYRALGGGGWTRAEAGSKKGAEAYRGELFKGYNTSNLGRGLKWAGRAIWDGITLNRLNEIVEQASRYAEYRYGQHDRSTAEGRQEAYLAAQESTTDFSRRGNSRMASEARMLVPFFNASLQGIYRTGRQLTEAERDRAGTRFMKTVINTGIVSALASAWMIKSMDDEEKEEFFWLSDDLKAKHIYLPNFAPDVLGDVPLIRIPLPQDPLTYAVHGAVTNAVWTGEGEEWAVGLSAIADNIMNSINPVGSTILDPLISTMTNKNWYGSNIVPRRMEDWEDETAQYTEETPDAFVEASRLLEASTGVSMSPMMLQYLAEQYTGFVGQIAIPLMTKDANTGKIGGIQAVIQKARNTLTSDPLKSNDVVSCVYDNEKFLKSITNNQKNGRPMNMLRNNLTERDARRAANEAYDLTHKGGAVYEAKKIITECYDEIEEIEANQSLSDDQKYDLVSRVRRDMIEAALDANEEMAAFRETYVDGESFLTRFMRAPVVE